MDFNEYQKKAHGTALYPKEPSISIECQQQVDLFPIYPVLKLTGEAGEVAEKIGKVMRDQNSHLPEDINFPLVQHIVDGKEIEYKISVNDIIKEMGDVLWYLAELSTNLGITLEWVATSNIEKLAKRKAEDKIHGSGDNR